MDSPQNHIWGPELWMILHSAAERIGQPHLKKMAQEETRIWSGLLSSLRYSLPCPQCKKHYTDYFSSKPIPPINQLNIRTWLYNLHCEVNTRTDKSNKITIEQIHELYSKPFHFSRHLGIVINQMTQAIRIRWCNRDDVNKTIRLFQEMKRFYDFF
jgi:hypothetical protein